LPQSRAAARIVSAGGNGSRGGSGPNLAEDSASPYGRQRILIGVDRIFQQPSQGDGLFVG
jgi:hypothetical protein